jgi:exodeoxyribonuclease VII large subunit
MSPLSSAAAPLRLSDLTALITDTINSTFRAQTFWVVAEIIDHSFKAGKNYHYFGLVEKHAESHELLARVPAVAWGNGSGAISRFESITGQPFTNNIQVLVNVSVQYHGAYGLQLILNEVDPNYTLGAMAQKREATLAQLVRENPEFIQRAGDQYITRNKQLRLGRVIQHVAVVCSSTSAGWQDFKHTLDANPYRYGFWVEPYFTLVQGETNSQQLVDSLVNIFRSGKSYDAVVIIRGGGAQTDFLLFDHYLVGKAIAKFPIPVITGIGHQKNETIADLMAHTAVKTPTKAAELIIAHNRSFEEALGSLQKLVVIKTQQRVAHYKDELTRIHRVTVHKSAVLVAGKIKDIEQTAASIRGRLPVYFRNQRGYLAGLAAMINALSPENTLKRGFAVVKVNGVVTSDPGSIALGSDIEVVLAQKSITATVHSKEDYHGTDFVI